MFVTDLSGNVVLQQNITSGIPNDLESTLVTLATSTTEIELCELGAVYISEAHNSGDPEDYIEIHNTGSEDCSLEGFQLDDSSTLNDFTFGDVVISAGGYWVGYEDADSSFSSGLSANGDSVVLADPNNNILSIELLPLEEQDDIPLSQSFELEGNGCFTMPTPGFANSDCITLSTINDNNVPTEFVLKQNYPNPFNPTTKIAYSVPRKLFLNAYITNINGVLVKSLFKENIAPGSHSITWNGTDNYSNNLPSGIYFLTLKSSNFNQTRKMMFLK
jgi:hypothetical protein